jgi:hypothetical protein
MTERPKYRVEREVYQSRMRVPEEADTAQYRAISGLAVTGLLLGLLALVGLIVPAAWLVALAGLVVNWVALRRVKAAHPALVGRKAAIAGLTLSLIISAAVPAEWLVHRYLVRDEARQFAALWFDSLRAGQPHKAHQLTISPASRVTLDDHLWEEYRQGYESRTALEGWVRIPEIRLLLALGDKATVRYYETESQGVQNDNDTVYQTYAVTYPDSDGLKTVFVGLVLVRTYNVATNHAYWHISRMAGGVKPKAFGGSGEFPHT